MNEPWMCEMCFPNGKEIKDFGDGLSLIYNNDKYALLAGQGHKGDELFIFDKMPTPDPYSQLMDDNIYETYQPSAEQERSSNEWWDRIQSLDWKLDIPTGWWFYNIFSREGYMKNPTKEHNMFEPWVYNYLGKIIAQS
jgi:hypothetical protein